MPATRATFYLIEGRVKENEMFFARRDDFVLGAATDIPSSQLVDEAGWAPYCIDADRRELVFVRLPADLDMSKVPFWQVTHYREAQALATLPLDALPALAATLPEPETTILVFSIGRCGTTLMSHVLNGSPRAYSISEPGAFDHRALRRLAEHGDTRLLIRALMKLCFATRLRKDESVLAVKFRSQALFIAEQFWDALPEAKYVFMYRDAIGWANSFVQFLSDMGMTLPPDEAGRNLHWQILTADRPLADMARFVDPTERPIRLEAAIAPGWTIHLEEYLRLLAAGVPFRTLRYNELVKEREASVAQIFDHCGLPLDGVAAALESFAEDSQKGTRLERKGEKLRLTPDQEAAMRRILAVVPALADPDTILPDIATR